MSRIQRPSSISDVIKILNDDSSDAAAVKGSASQTSTQTSKASSGGTESEVAKLKSDIVNSIQALSLDEPEERESARKILISKIIQWHFQSVIRNSAQKAYLTETVNKSIKTDDAANEQLETLLKKITSS